MMPQSSSGCAASENAPCGAPSARQAAIDVNLDADPIRDALAQLPEQHRAMIYRSYYLGQTTTQIAAELRTNDDFVKHELHRALHALRMKLQESGDITRT